MRRLLPGVLAALAVSSAAAAPQQAARTPGTIALLADAPAHEADEDLRQALVDPDPVIRSVAARVAGVGDHKELLGNIVGALLREKHARTGAELVRSALYLGGERDLPLIDREVQRLGAPARSVRVEWLARVKPAEFLTMLRTAEAHSADEYAGAFVGMASVQHPQLRSELLAAWMSVAPEEGWGDLLESIYGFPAAIAPATEVISTALTSERSSIREDTVWFLVAALRDKRAIPKQILEAAGRTHASTVSDWERFGRELLARRRTREATADRTSLLQPAAPVHRLRALKGLAELLDTERKALATLARGAEPASDWNVGRPATRTVNLTGGIAPSTLAAAGCTGNGEMGQAQLAYWPDGRPRRITVDRSRLPPPCVQAVSALARLSIAERFYPVSEDLQTVVVPLHATFRQCRGTFSRPFDAVRSLGSDMFKSPALIREVKPSYSREAFQGRVEGLVFVVATLSEEGCVEAAHVSRGLPGLDLSALWAVTQWIFEPARINGQPVPVRVNIELKFTMK